MKMKNKENNEKEDDTNNPNLSNMTKDSNLKNVIETKEEIKKNTSGASFTYFFDFKPCKNFKLNLHGNNPYKTNYDQIKFFNDKVEEKKPYDNSNQFDFQTESEDDRSNNQNFIGPSRNIKLGKENHSFLKNSQPY